MTTATTTATIKTPSAANKANGSPTNQPFVLVFSNGGGLAKESETPVVTTTSSAATSASDEEQHHISGHCE